MLNDYYDDVLSVFRTQTSENLINSKKPRKTVDLPVFYDSQMRLLGLPSDWLEDYANGRATASTGRCSFASACTYADQLVNFLNYLAIKGESISKISFETLTNYRDDQLDGTYSYRRRPVNERTINARVKTASKFCDWLFEKGHLAEKATRYGVVTSRRKGIHSNSGELVETKANSLHLTEQEPDLDTNFPTQEEIDQALKNLKARGQLCRTQELAVELMRLSGLRSVEVQNLTTANFDSIRPIAKSSNLFEAKILGKGNKYRWVEIPLRLYDKMRNYAIWAEKYRPPGSDFFLVYAKSRKALKKYEYSTMEKFVSRKLLTELCHVTGNPSLSLTCHSLRHIYAGDLYLRMLNLKRPLTNYPREELLQRMGSSVSGPRNLVGGMKLQTNQDLALMAVKRRLGHKYIETTLIYQDWANKLLMSATATEEGF